MYEYRLYIDESGDHGYKHADQIENRYLGLTGLLVNKPCYDDWFKPNLEQVKKAYFEYDPDKPPVLVCNWIKGRKGCFGVLQDSSNNEKWEGSILNYFSSLLYHCQLFTVVVDKQEHRNRFPNDPFDPYTYAFKVLLRRVRGYLCRNSQEADIIPEARGSTEDNKLRQAYNELKIKGDRWGKPEEYNRCFPSNSLFFGHKSHNIAGLQVVDLLAYGQKLETIAKRGGIIPTKISTFTKRVNEAVYPMVNPYGQYLLV